MWAALLTSLCPEMLTLAARRPHAARRTPGVAGMVFNTFDVFVSAQTPDATAETSGCAAPGDTGRPQSWDSVFPPGIAGEAGEWAQGWGGGVCFPGSQGLASFWGDRLVLIHPGLSHFFH